MLIWIIQLCSLTASQQCRCRYLIESGSRLDATNNDNELPVDLADGDEMETLLTQYMNKLGQNGSQIYFHLYH